MRYPFDRELAVRVVNDTPYLKNYSREAFSRRRALTSDPFCVSIYGEMADWFEDGIRFTCTRCGNCCVGDPGAVWFNPEEERALAEKTKLSLRTFRKKYVVKIDGQPSLGEVSSDRGQHCVFLQKGSGGCSVYDVRPKQCRTWPFWPENLQSFRKWIDASKSCPGILNGLEGRGKLHSAKKVRNMRDRTPPDPESYEV